MTLRSPFGMNDCCLFRSVIARRAGTLPIEALGRDRVKADDSLTNKFARDGSLEPAH